MKKNISSDMKCSSKYSALLDENNKLVNNIANFGINKYQRAKILRQGEYFGFECEILADVRPLLTNNKVKQVIVLLEKTKIDEIVKLLKIYQEFQQFGEDVIHYILFKWFTKNKLDIPDCVNEVELDKTDDLDKFILLTRSDSIMAPIKITNIGFNEKKKESVVPAEWINKEFSSGAALHKAMNELPNRKGKPPVTYCCTYGMAVINEKILWQKLNLDNLKTSEIKFALLIEKNKHTEVIKVSNISNIKSIEKFNVIQPNKHFVIIVENGIFEKRETNKKESDLDNVGYLSSLLQKCFRNGPIARNILSETIEKLNMSPGYNLPDHQFIRVSGCRQLLWRTYISIVEDVCGYITSDDYDLLDILSLALVVQIDSNILLSKSVLNKLKSTLEKVLQISKLWDWRAGSDTEVKLDFDTLINESNRNRISTFIALLSMPMMTGDRTMLTKVYNLGKFEQVELKNVINIDEIDEIDELEIRMRAYDMHCAPNVLIQLQGCLPYIPTDDETLHKLSGFIWKNSSRYNYRHAFKYEYSNSNQSHILTTLMDIQYDHIVKEPINLNNKWIKLNSDSEFEYTKNNINENDYVSRLAFILAFGQKVKLQKKINNKICYAILAGSNDEPCKIKTSMSEQYDGKNITKSVYLAGKDRYTGEKYFLDQISKKTFTTNLQHIVPPRGYVWKNTNLTYSIKLLDSDSKNNINKLALIVDNTKINIFDGSSLICKKNRPNEECEIPEELEYHLNVAFYNDVSNILFSIFSLMQIAKDRFRYNDLRLFHWIHLTCNISADVWRQVKGRILMCRSNDTKYNEINIGPVDRTGNKTRLSISYKYEGVIWRLLIALAALYPDVIIIEGFYKFKLNKESNYAEHMFGCIDQLLNNNLKMNDYGLIKLPVVKTALWDHQNKSASRIAHGFTYEKRKGFGDASDVGSGKTLTALATICKLCEYCKLTKLKTVNKGFLILLPSDKLYKTWNDEIEKHTDNFYVVEQKANGDITDDITESTILITTMGRMREHPIDNAWMLTVIDECLTVQNKEALQTEEAWRQVLNSYFGVLMLSATFFRSRFDKMLFMLSMLDTQIPITADSLDLLLSESMICNINKNDRFWTSDIHYYELEKKIRKEYDNIVRNHTSAGLEKTYNLLMNIINTNINYIDLFYDAFCKLLKSRPNAKILIFAKSKDEADKIAKLDKNIGRYPKLKKHVVVSYAEGTFGVNDLVVYDTILTRPPDPDKLPQMKGRIDRYGQQRNQLYIEYILLKNTIEEAGLYKLDVAKNFYRNHLLPLAEFYKLAIFGDTVLTI